MALKAELSPRPRRPRRRRTHKGGRGREGGREGGKEGESRGRETEAAKKKENA
jgi:hypothetical protein